VNKSNQTWPKSTEEKCLADDAFRQTIAALDRFNQRMLDAGYKVRKSMASEDGNTNTKSSKQTKSTQRIQKAA